MVKTCTQEYEIIFEGKSLCMTTLVDIVSSDVQYWSWLATFFLSPSFK